MCQEGIQEWFPLLDCRPKILWLLGGKIAGKVLLKYANKVFTFKNTDGASKETLELTAKIDVGNTADIEAKKNGESMWTYKTKRVTVSDNTKFEMTLDTEMTLSNSSAIHKFLSDKDKYFACLFIFLE